MKSKLASFKGWICLALVFIFLRLPSLFEPNWYGDEAIYLVLGRAIRQGWTLYSQIHDNKPPSLYILAAISQTVFGFRLLLFLWMIPTVYFFYKLSRQFFNPFFAKFCLFIFIVLTSAPLIEGNIANAEIFMLLPTILAFLVFNPDNLNSITASALFLGIAFTFKMPALFDALALGFYFLTITFFKKSKQSFSQKFLPFFGKTLVYIISFLSPFLIFAIYYWSKYSLQEFLNASLFQNFPYLSSWQTGSHSASPLQGGLFTRFIILLFFYFFSLLIFLKNKITQKHFLLLIWLSSTIFAAFLSGRPYPHYLLQAVPAFCLTLTLLFYNNPFFTKATIVLTALTIYGLASFNFYFYKNIKYYQAFYLNFGKPHIFKNFFGSHVSKSQQIVDHLQTQKLTDRQVFVWGDAPYIYVEANILPADKYTVAYHINDFQTHHQTMENLKKYTPTFIVYYQMPQRPFPELDKFISNYYVLDNLIDSVSIYKKR